MASDKICKVCDKILPRKEDWEDLYLILTLKEEKTSHWAKTLSNNFFLRNFCSNYRHEDAETEQDP